MYLVQSHRVLCALTVNMMNELANLISSVLFGTEEVKFAN